MAASVPSRDFAAFGFPVAPVPFTQLQSEVLALYMPPMRAKKTYLIMRLVLSRVGNLLAPDATTAELATPALVARYIAAQPPGQSNNTLLTHLATLRTVCTYAMQMGYIRISPFLLSKVGSWVRREKSRRPRQHVSREEISRILAKAKSEITRKRSHSQAGPWSEWRARRLHALVNLIAFTGLRKMEALYLRVEDLDLRAGLLSVVARAEHRLKTVGSERTVPIALPLAEVLREWLPYVKEHGSGWVFPNCYGSAPWTGGSHGYRPLDKLKTLGRRAGVPDLTFQVLRHSFATHARYSGLSREQVAMLMGHTQLSTQDYYVHEDLPSLKGLTDRLDFGTEGGAK